MHLSIVIPTYNRSRLLPQTIPALARQLTADGITYEVIFVINGSTDDSEQLLEDATVQFPGTFKYFRIDPTGGPSAPRNVGIRAASGEVVIILDDDVAPEPDLVQRYAEFHTKYPQAHHAAIGEVYVPENLLRDPMSGFHSIPYDPLRKLDRLSYLHFWTCNLSIKRQFMLDAGMFDESFLYHEDVLCGYRLAGHGMHLHFWPSARGQHLHQMTSAGFAAKSLFIGRWLYPLMERIPDPALAKRMGILSADLPASVVLRRLAARAAYGAIDNPLTMWILEKLGARSSQRSAVTDFYYRLIFRRNFFAGYREAKRHAEAGRRLNLTQVDSALADRGDR